MSYSMPLVVWFWVILLSSVVIMKLSSLRTLRPKSTPAKFVFLSPVFSTLSWDKKVTVNSSIVLQAVVRFILLFFPFLISWWVYLTFVTSVRPSVLIQCYLALLPLYCLGQFASALLEVVYLPTGWLFPAHFQFPPLSKSLSEFWGVRWASWIADWLRQMVFSRYRRKPALGLFVAFFISGLWHEVLINIPLYLFHGVNVLGSMLIYFLIQALAMLGERKLPLGNSFLRRIYMWAVVLIPAPLVMNEGILRSFGLFVQ